MSSHCCPPEEPPGQPGTSQRAAAGAVSTMVLEIPREPLACREVFVLAGSQRVRRPSRFPKVPCGPEAASAPVGEGGAAVLWGESACTLSAACSPCAAADESQHVAHSMVRRMRMRFPGRRSYANRPVGELVPYGKAK